MEGNGIFPNPQVLLAQVVTFVIGMGAVWVLYLKPLGKHLRERRDGISKDLAAADSARAEAAKLKAEFDTEKARLLDESRRLIEKTKADAEAFRADLMAKAKAEHEALLKAGHAQLEQERLEAIRQVRVEAASLIVAATEKLLEKNLDKKTSEALAQKFVASVKVSKN